MPVHRTSKPGCFQWGEHGHIYCGPGAASKAAAQGRAAFAHGYRGKGHARRTEISHPDLVRLWNTQSLREGDDIPGIGVVHDHALVTYHVTDDPSRPATTLRKRANLQQAYGPKGAHAELGPGLYVSGQPSYWLARARSKWSFIATLTQAQLQCVTEALEREVRERLQAGYLSEREGVYAGNILRNAARERPRPEDRRAGVRRDLGNFENLTMLASQPFNIAWWKAEWLARCGVQATPRPQALELRVRGVFGEAGRARPDPGLLRMLRRMGVAGVLTRSGFGTAPEMVIWDPASVVGSKVVDV